MRNSVDPPEAERRLQMIFPRAAFDTVLSNPLAGLAITALLYIDAVCKVDDQADLVVWARPSTVTWMSQEALSRQSDADRELWRKTAAGQKKHVEALHQSWGVPFAPLYADNSRETLRDETFRLWHEHGAMRKKAGVATSSSRPRWALLDDFADLFDPTLTGEELEKAASDWRELHLDPGTRLKVNVVRKAETDKHAVTITLPDGTARTLEPGKSSHILKGVVESWAPTRLTKPVVLAISEPGVKVHLGDEQLLQVLGIKIDQANVLPDALLADLGTEPVHFWIVEAVATDGPVSRSRRMALLGWAAQQNIKSSRCSFLTAFLSRNAEPAKRRLKDLAPGTWAWFVSEPHHELAWYSFLPAVED
ncbi:BsuBI/PstI family type II restriction endonuclease [Micromonospora inaquosa]|nr:BsuBI/PstI family type II restriction endonuclease [Micromonospora inaquosa]